MLESVNGDVYQKHHKTRAHTQTKKKKYMAQVYCERRFTHNRGSCLFLHKTALISLTSILPETTVAGGNY